MGQRWLPSKGGSRQLLMQAEWLAEPAAWGPKQAGNFIGHTQEPLSQALKMRPDTVFQQAAGNLLITDGS